MKTLKLRVLSKVLLCQLHKTVELYSWSPGSGHSTRVWSACHSAHDRHHSSITALFLLGLGHHSSPAPTHSAGHITGCGDICLANDPSKQGQRQAVVGRNLKAGLRDLSVSLLHTLVLSSPVCKRDVVSHNSRVSFYFLSWSNSRNRINPLTVVSEHLRAFWHIHSEADITTSSRTFSLSTSETPYPLDSPRHCPLPPVLGATNLLSIS